MKTRVNKVIVPCWRSRISSEEIEQEELIFKWKHPELSEFAGLFVYSKFLFDHYIEEKKKKPPLEVIQNLNRENKRSSCLEDLFCSDYLIKGCILIHPVTNKEVDLTNLSPNKRYMLLYLALNGKTHTANKFSLSPSDISKFLNLIKNT